MDNPLLAKDPLPHFSRILPEHIEPALKQVISQNLILLNELLAKGPPFTWDNLMAPLEEMNDKLNKLWSPVAHLHGVAESEALRNAYNACLPLLSDYTTEIMQNEKLYHAVKSIADSLDYKNLDTAQRKVIEDELRDFKLAGVALPPSEKIRFAEIQKQLSLITTKFSENVLDATHAWTFHVTDLQTLKGLPEQSVQLLAENAAHLDKTGWVITLDSPCYSTVMKYLDNREIRWLLYEANCTRASDQGPHAGRFDNGPVMEEILKLRQEKTALLGFNHFADLSLATKMAKSPEEVLTFLEDMSHKAKKFGEQDMKELQEFAKQMDGIEPLEAWDMAYYSEKLLKSKFAFQQEDLRPYFPINKVLAGMFTIINKIFGLTITEHFSADTWHPSVQLFDILDKDKNYRGSFYTDLYARPHKREGAWMDDARVRRRLADGSIQQPVAFLTCNFTRPIGNRPALLTHDDVVTLFHEFGHCLHHLLTQIDYAAVSGINGVPWDAVEVPSQFLERWCYEKEALTLISQHIDTNEPLPDLVFHKLTASKNFQAGMHVLRQCEFALFDFNLHLEKTPPDTHRIQQLLDIIRKQISVVKPPAFNRFQNTFSHIFGGGYAAGYYSYLWAEVLSSDAFSKFEETGIFNAATGQEFLKTILEQGGSKHPMDLFVAFRGRKPSVDALLKHNGFIEEN